MSDRKTVETPLLSEIVPGQAGEISAIASANAPFVSFDLVPFMNHADGISRITLAAVRQARATEGGIVITDLVATAHLRCGIGGLMALRDCCQKIIDAVASQTQKPDGDTPRH